MARFSLFLALTGLLGAGIGCDSAREGLAVVSADGWRELEPGLQLGSFAAPHPWQVGDGRIRVLRIDPSRFELRLLNASALGRTGMTARQWCRAHGMVAALNASMYQEDHRTSVSLMRTAEHTNNSRLTRDQTILAFDRRDPDAPPVKIIDRECDDFEEWAQKYGSLVQSIRMISCNGENVWQQQPRKWSTAAIGTDREGRVLFVHVRSPFSTHDLIDMLIDLPLHLENLMYAEGGPEAQLYVRAAAGEYEFVGSFEAARGENDNNVEAWPVPNVVAVARREDP